MRTVGLRFAQAPQVFACPHCGKAYKTGEALDKHIRDKHPDTNGHM